jgi:hypothetical protein
MDNIYSAISIPTQAQDFLDGHVECAHKWAKRPMYHDSCVSFPLQHTAANLIKVVR